jgi:hypothetical protein
MNVISMGPSDCFGLNNLLPEPASLSLRRWGRLAIGGILLMLLVGCKEDMSAFYDTYADAERAGAVNRGWIPPYVPPSATEITEVHNLDVNSQRIRFQAPLADLRLMTEGMRMVPRSDLPTSNVYLPPMEGDWSPGSDENLRFYEAPDGGAARCVAVDWERARTYGWTC